MPAYKTHAIYGEIVLPQIDKEVDIDKEYMKLYSFGPDSLITTDYRTFEYQHIHKVKIYFEHILKHIKKNGLQDNSEVIAFLYGQLAHYILDVFTHPLINYMTENVDSQKFLTQHAIVEMWIDDYIMQRFGKTETFYFHKNRISDRELIGLINKVYRKVYHVLNEANKYNIGMTLMTILDSLGRTNIIVLFPAILKICSIGDVTFGDPQRVLPYLNLDHQTWTNPVSGEKSQDSFDDLWDKSIDVYLETIDDVNRYLYRGKNFTNSLISNNISYNTGFRCKRIERLPYVKTILKKMH